MRSSTLAAALAVAALAPTPSRALDRFEIQVYEDDVNEPGQPSLEVHLNYTARGTDTPAFPGEVPPDRVGRLTLEPALGATEWLELGAYVQGFVAPGVAARFGGVKLRAKMVVPEHVRARLGVPLFLGLNAEIGRVPKSVEEQGWANEFRPIVGWRSADWLVVANPIFGYALTGPDRFRVDLEPCAKVALNTRRGFSVGAEWYGGLGFVDAILPPREQEHLLLAVLDLVPGEPERGGPTAEESPWELNVGVGGALTSATDRRVVVKAIVGRAF